MTDNEVKIINNAITRLLASREHSRQELLNKLINKGFDANLCRQQIEKFSNENIQSDNRFTEVFVRSKAQKGFGESRIRMELREHDIDGAAVSEAIQELEIDWFELAVQVLNKKFGSQSVGDWKEQQKRQRFLQYRGFTGEQIKYAMANEADGE